MALTLPTEISTEKDKLGHSPILLVEFSDLGVYVGSREYTLDYGGGTNHTFQDAFSRGMQISLNTRLPQKLNSYNSLASMTLRLLDFRGTYRADLLQSSPDLTNSAVAVYLKYDTGNNLKSNSLQIYQGYVNKYSIQRDKLTLNLKTTRTVLPDTPQHLLIDDWKYTEAGKNITRPLQYGDFSWDADPRFWGDNDSYYAICPLHSAPTGASTWTYFIADHVMKQLPSVSQVQDEDNAYVFVVRDNLYVHVKFAGGTFTNNVTQKAYFSAAISVKEAYLFLPPTAEETSNNVTGWSYAIDGKASTLATVTSTEDLLSVETCGFDDLVENELNSTSAFLLVYLGEVVGSPGGIIRATNGTNTYESFISASDSDRWIQRSFPISSLADIENFWFQIEHYGAGGNYVEVKEMIIKVQVQDVSTDDKYLYMRCKGRQYGDTWGGRKTIGDVIENPADVIESLLRDEWGYGDSDIDSDSFDNVNSFLSTVKAKGTFFEQNGAYKLIDSICEMFNFSLTYNLLNKWRLFMPLFDANVFTNSGTDTPSDEDIFTDTDVISNNSYSRHPIKWKGFLLQRTQNDYDKLTLKYKRVADDYLESLSSGSDGEEIVISNFLVGDLTSATNLRNKIDNWLLAQKFIAVITTFHNALAFELGDVINIRHDDLNDDILYATVNTQKWMIFSLTFEFRPAIIKIRAVELK